MVVSSNTLFQFTGDKETLVKILTSKGFWPKYCIEYGWNEKLKFDFAVPECCFCDIPLSSIQQHMAFYGGYGIGMTKEWGIQRGLSPVMYVISGAHFTNVINGIRKAATGVEENTKFFAFLKRYKSINYKKKDGKLRRIQNYLYYNEREWRYVPSELSAKEMIVKVSDKNTFNADAISQMTMPYMCAFEATDIKYMIVKDDTERNSLVHDIETLDNWSKTDRELLASKILTHALIEEDI